MKIKVLCLTTASHGVNHMFWESIGPLLPFLIVSFSLSHTQAGRLGFISSLLYGLANYPAGHLSDKYGHRKFILLFLIITSLATLLMIFTKTYLFLFLLFALAGLGGGIYHPPGTALLANSYPSDQRGKALGIHASGGAFGILVSYIIIGIIAPRWGWKLALVLLSIIGLGLAVIFRLFLWEIRNKDDAASRGSKPDSKREEKPIGLMTLIKWIPLMVIIYSFVMFLFKGSYVWVPMYLKETYNFSVEKAIVFALILPIFGIFSNYLMGILSDKFGRKISLIFVFSILSICFFFLYMGNRTLLIPVLCVFGFFINSFSGIVNAYIRDYLPPDIMGRAYGILFTCSICVSAFAPYVMGIISDKSSLAVSMLFLCFVSLAGIVISFKTPKKVAHAS